jgi:hypothetical protein
MMTNWMRKGSRMMSLPDLFKMMGQGRYRSTRARAKKRQGGVTLLQR